MTSFAQRAATTRPAAAPPWRVTQRLVIRWNAVLPATRRPFTLEWTIRMRDGALVADAAAIDGASRQTLDDFQSIPVRWTHDERLSIHHFDAPPAGPDSDDVPALNASVDLSQQPPAILFARTGALRAMGLPGGRYEPAGGAILDDPA